MNKLIAALELMRLDKPIGIYLLMWPALLALVISTQGNLTLESIAIVIFGSILVRSAGCVINDLWDKDLDGKVERTKMRPIPSKKLTLLEGWIIFGLLGALSIGLLSITNIKTIIIGCIFAAMIIIYPLTKRFFIGPQLFLGITFNPIIIVFALSNQLENPTMPYLYFAMAAWIVAYDSFYGLCDKEDDQNLGINSTPLWWGGRTLKIITLFQIILMGLLCVIGWVDELNILWFFGVLCLSGFFLYQHKLASKKRYLEAFRNNHWANLYFLLIAVISYMG